MNSLRVAWQVMLIVALLVSADQAYASPPASCLGVNCVYLPFVSVPQPVLVYESTLMRPLGGGTRVLGDVLNTATYPVYGVALTVRLYDSSDQLSETLPVTPVLTATLPNQLNPFDVVSNRDDTSHYEVEVSSWHVTSTQTYRPATVALTQTGQAFGSWVVTATLRNDQPVPLLNVNGVTWSLSQDSGVFRQALTPSLAPGALVTFTTFLGQHDYPVPIRVSAQGIITP